MSGLGRVMWRELTERWVFLAAGLSFGLLPFLLGPTVVIPAHRGALATWLATILTLLTAAVSGSAFGSDLAEGRLGFFFMRPLGWWQIWGGKLVAGVGLTALVAMVTIAPAFLLEWEGVYEAWRSSGPRRAWPLSLVPSTVFVAACWILLFVGTAHFASVAYRSRSPRLILDMAAAAGVVWTLPRLGVYAFEGGPVTLLVLAVPSLLIAAAGGAQVAIGRVDLVRSHKVLSLVLWPTLAVWALTLARNAEWIRFAPPPQVNHFGWVDASPRGPWILGQGAYGSLFLVDTRTHRAEWYLDSRSRQGVAFSGDGRRAVWLTDSGPNDSGLAFVDLDARLAPKLSNVSGQVSLLAVSPDGRSALTFGRAELHAYDVDSGRLLFSLPSPSEPTQAQFMTPSLIRMVHCIRADGDGNQTFEIVDLDLVNHRVNAGGRIEDVWRHADFRLDPMTNAMLLVECGGSVSEHTRITLRDGSSGRWVATLAQHLANRETWCGYTAADFLADGRPAVVTSSGLQVFSMKGEPQISVPGIVRLGGQPDLRHLFVGLRGFGTVLIDTLDGSIRRREQNVWPMVWRPSAAAPGADAVWMFESVPAKELFRLDPATTARHRLLWANDPAVRGVR